MVFYPCSLRNLLIGWQELRVQPGSHHHLLRATSCFRFQEEPEAQESTSRVLQARSGHGMEQISLK